MDMEIQKVSIAAFSLRYKHEMHAVTISQSSSCRFYVPLHLMAPISLLHILVEEGMVFRSLSWECTLIVCTSPLVDPLMNIAISFRNHLPLLRVSLGCGSFPTSLVNIE
jgi:hypothetical protein